jgi:hypothetical protein
MRRLLLLTLLLLTLPASSQIVSVYGTFAPTHVSNVPNGITNTAPGYVTASYWAPGVGAGLTLNFIPVGPIKLGLDVRGSTKPGTSGSDLILAGPRLAVKVPFIGLKPYIQAEGGYLRTRTALATGPAPGTTFVHDYAAWEVAGGVDYPFAPFLDLRVIEFGGGKGYLWNDSSSSPRASFYTVSTGLVFHF